jgi:hypothetical protein
VRDSSGHNPRLFTTFPNESLMLLPLPAALERRMNAEELAISPVSALEVATKIRKGHFPGIPPQEQWFSAAIDG